MNCIGPVRLPLRTDGTVREFVLKLFATLGQRYLIAENGHCVGTENLLVRVSSMCNFGHIWGSEYCDCQWQFQEAKRLIIREGSGLIVFAFDHHGKGVGLENHYRVYSEGQAHGLELVVDAYSALGFTEDARDHSEIALLLKQGYGLQKIRLLTNNPKRLSEFHKAGLICERVPLEMPMNKHNQVELTVKKRKLGHLLSFPSEIAAD